MQKKLTITVDEKVYAGLHDVIGRLFALQGRVTSTVGLRISSLGRLSFYSSHQV